MSTFTSPEIVGELPYAFYWDSSDMDENYGVDTPDSIAAILDDLIVPGDPGKFGTFFKYVATQTRRIKLSVYNSNDGHYLQVFEQNTGPVYTPVANDADLKHSQGGTGDSEETLSVTSGKTYYIWVGNYFGYGQELELDVAFRPIPQDVATLDWIEDVRGVLEDYSEPVGTFTLVGSVIQARNVSWWNGPLVATNLQFPDTHGLLWHITIPYSGPYYNLTIGTNFGVTLAARYAGGGVTWSYFRLASPTNVTGGGTLTVSIGGADYLRIYRSGNTFVCECSPNGITWANVFTTPDFGSFDIELGGEDSDGYQVFLETLTNNDIHSIEGTIVAGSVDPTTKPPRAPRTFNPGALNTAAAKECSSLLDLVRVFSAAVRKAVRIVNGSTIEMVDPDEPLPTGWSIDDAAEYYSSVTQALSANSKVLSLEKGNMDLAVSANIIVNDVGIITGGFAIPARLPVPGLDPAPVSRVSYTFTPKEFRASVDFAFPDAPLSVRER